MTPVRRKLGRVAKVADEEVLDGCDIRGFHDALENKRMDDAWKIISDGAENLLFQENEDTERPSGMLRSKAWQPVVYAGCKRKQKEWEPVRLRRLKRLEGSFKALLKQ